ncbi:hypothetical protein [Pararhodobacter sp.]|uniref:hypothetical protein n=1 Tax=Pararhodobacter sp. TaxID=2127056 RepID=UPI002AFEA219|nr:hypothetical protein [Pararhodobacter sp.]
MDGKVNAVIIASKACHSYRTGEPLEGSAAQVNINLPSAMTPEDYRKLVDVTPKK